ncbi:hypothetical protein MRB53_037181 [Persea americana]|nr:hypothetical protein MRB53_037181 [Persea americana]
MADIHAPTVLKPSPRAMTAEQLFDDVGPAYEQAYADQAESKHATDWIIAELSAKSIKRGRLLDVGCGTGRPVCSRLADTGHDVLGIDVSGVMVEHARKAVPNASFEKIDIRSFQADEGSFDAITSFFALLTDMTHQDIRDVITSIYKWLKPGGCFVLGTCPLSGPEMQEERWLGRMSTISSLDVDEFLRVITGCGFEVVHHSLTYLTPRAEEAGLCKQEDVWEEPRLHIHALKAL